MTIRIRAWQNNLELYQQRAAEAHSYQNQRAYAEYTASVSSAHSMDTTKRLKALRGLFDKQGIDIYIVLSQDPHESEWVSDADKRREYISGMNLPLALWLC